MMFRRFLLFIAVCSFGALALPASLALLSFPLAMDPANAWSHPPPFGGNLPGRFARSAASPIPPTMLELYVHSAMQCPGLPWEVLAGIGRVETDHGQADGVSSAGAQGPMQFMPSTFAIYGVDAGDGDAPNVWDPADAVLSAAEYLCANGAGQPGSVVPAIWHYNHSYAYVTSVLNYASEYELQYPTASTNRSFNVPDAPALP